MLTKDKLNEVTFFIQEYLPLLPNGYRFEIYETGDVMLYCYDHVNENYESETYIDTNIRATKYVPLIDEE
jgi:hypothetical protein